MKLSIMSVMVLCSATSALKTTSRTTYIGMFPLVVKTDMKTLNRNPCYMYQTDIGSVSPPASKTGNIPVTTPNLRLSSDGLVCMWLTCIARIEERTCSTASRLNARIT